MTTTDTPSATAAAGALGTLQHVAPGSLLLERNIRDAKIDPGFVESVRELGLLEPITAVTNADGDLVVRFGHRRTLAAVEAGLDTVPVYVAGSDDLADDAEIDRIIRQRDENTRRDGLTTGDDVGVVTQLAAFGLKADQIAKRARIPRDQVKTALRVATSTLASKAAERYEALTLDQAAVVAEFEDSPDIAKKLIVTAVQEPEQFAHLAQRERDDRERTQKVDELRAKLMAAGVKIVEQPDYGSKIDEIGGEVIARGRWLDKPGGAEITADAHRDCPGHVGWVTKYHAPSIRYGCRDPHRYGHHDAWSHPQSTSRTPVAEMSEAEREQARADRRLVIDNNKAWESAETVRREWLGNFAKLRTPPKGAGAFIARAIAEHAGRLNENAAHELAAKLLGVKTNGWSAGPGIAKTVDGVTEQRALHVALVQVLAGYEASLTTASWRRDGRTSEDAAYLRFLEQFGYPLSDVEKYAVSRKTV